MKFPAWIAALGTALMAALLPACDQVNLQKIEPGVTTQAEVRQRMGEPGFVHWNDDGTPTWEYARQPNGMNCYMISFGADERVRQVEQVLNPKNYARIRDGLAKDDVRRILGAPGSKIVYDNLREEVWEWRIEGANPLDETYYMVHFDTRHGAVKNTSQRVATKG